LRWWAFRFLGRQIGIGQMRLLVQHHSFIPFASLHERIDGHGLITASVGAGAPEDFDFGSPISMISIAVLYGDRIGPLVARRRQTMEMLACYRSLDRDGALATVGGSPRTDQASSLALRPI
jgi:hypothetical protein